jgi:hypothetical protein
LESNTELGLGFSSKSGNGESPNFLMKSSKSRSNADVDAPGL